MAAGRARTWAPNGVGKSHEPVRCRSRGAVDARPRSGSRARPSPTSRRSSPTGPGGSCPTTTALWEFSTQDLAGFWSAIADYFQVRWHQQPTEVLPAAVMPGADWFPGGTLNYAEHALAGLRRGDAADPSADPAVIVVAEDGSEQLVDARRSSPRWSAPRRPGCAPSASGPAIGWSRWCRTRCTRWSASWRPPRWARCGVVLPGFRCAVRHRPVHPDLPDGAARGRRLPVRRPRVRRSPTRCRRSAMRCPRSPAPCTSRRSAPPTPDGMIDLGGADLRRRQNRYSRRSRSPRRCGCCTRPAPPGCPSRSSSRSAAFCWST